VVNNINLSANTGGNNANHNTGGNSSITTGDANIIANLVNFVNNNVTGGGRLIVTVVNVFGSWFGNFVTPGHTDDSQLASDPNSNNQASSQSQSSGTQNSGSGSLNTSSSNSSSNPTHTPNPLGTYITTNLPKANAATLLASLNSTNGSGEVLGASTESNASFTKGKININLAWLIPGTIIFVLSYLLVKKVKVFRK